MRVHLADDLTSFIKEQMMMTVMMVMIMVIMMMVMGTLGDDHVSFI